MRRARDMNTALLTKLGWRMETEPESLWVRVIRNKYTEEIQGSMNYRAKEGLQIFGEGYVKRKTS